MRGSGIFNTRTHLTSYDSQSLAPNPQKYVLLNHLNPTRPENRQLYASYSTTASLSKWKTRGSVTHTRCSHWLCGCSTEAFIKDTNCISFCFSDSQTVCLIDRKSNTERRREGGLLHTMYLEVILEIINNLLSMLLCHSLTRPSVH